MPQIPSIGILIASTTPTSQGMFEALVPYGYFEIGLILAVLVISFVVGVVSSNASRLFSGRSSGMMDTSDPYRNSTSGSIGSQTSFLRGKGRIF